MRGALLTGLIFTAWAMCAQQPNLPDCSATPEDPRCQAVARDPIELPVGVRRLPVMPRSPVIRDQEVPAGPESHTERTGRGTNRLINPPEQPTEFQKFIERSTGRLLPLFGRNLFRGAPSTFAPIDRVPVAPEYLLGPGDQLLVRGWGQIDLNVAPVVDRTGTIYIPQVGDLNVAGLRFAQAQDFLKTAISRVYRNFDLSVSMGQLRSIQIFIMGHARQPGAYTVGAFSSLVNALFVCGGPDAGGSMRHIRLVRADGQKREFDLYNLLLAGDKSQDVRLMPGDVIYIPPTGPQVAITGSVNTPAIYELSLNATLADGLAMAGGLTPVAARQRALIERISGSSRRAIEVPLDGDGIATPLRDGDLVKILAIPPGFENTVTLRGNVADPVRLPWRPGMRVLDLIPSPEALLSRDYWNMRNRLQPDGLQDSEKNEAAYGEAAYREGGPNPKAATVVPVSVDRGFSPAQSTRTKPSPALNGASTPAAIAGPRPDESPEGNRIERNPYEVNWSYAVIERRDPVDLHTHLIPFHPGKAILEHDRTANLPLEPGDIVTIFSTADLKVAQNQQTRYVRLEGEFASAGVYGVLPGETLRALVRRAGGLTAQAYLFGSEFVRESSRVEQQQRLDDLVNSLDRQATSAAANVRGTVISQEEAVAASSQIEGQRELIRKMRQVRATGRIVLDLDSRLAGVDGLPELPLEDGDVFTVPSRPAFVNVVGAVHNGTSFVYRENRSLGEYLRAAGGPTRTGDSRHSFLIRADGSVVSKSWTGGILRGGFEALPLNPGDTVVVPEQINKTTFLKGLKDWSQVFAQFGLGAAAINILR